MKLRTSSFNRTVFRKDLTRFAPAWAVYAIVLLLGLLGIQYENHAYYRISNIEQTVTIMAWVNLCYGPVVAQLLFGDLYNARLCNALHALPVTRKSWYVTHTAAGLAFSLLPNLVISAAALLVINLGAGWTAVALGLLAVTLQYLFFFGTAVLCMMLSGNRLGQLAAYTIIQFAGILAFWLSSNLYEPLLYGILIPEGPFELASPLLYLSNHTEVFTVDYKRLTDTMGDFLGFEVYGVTFGESWGYLAICAGLGLLALAGGMALYKNRKLECAGDFVAFTQLQPVMTLLVTVFAVGFVFMCGEAFGLNLKYVLLAAGMIVGFFGCRMLLARSTRVFRKKAFLGCGAIMAAVALTLVLTYLDPVGITRYQPDAEDVESITFSHSYTLFHHGDFPYTVTEEGQIRELMEVHRDCITKEANQLPADALDAYPSFNLRLEYKLKNGKTVNRFYDVLPNSDAGKALKKYFSTTEAVLGFAEEELPTAIPYIYSLYTEGYSANVFEMDGVDVAGLLAAIAADCRAGNMAQHSGYHYPNNYDLLGYEESELDETVTYLEFGWDNEQLKALAVGRNDIGSSISYSMVRVYRSCTNTVAWLKENGLLTGEMMKELEICPEPIFVN